MNDVLLTISGTMDPAVRDQVARGERPEADYLRMAQTFGSDLMDYAAARKLAGIAGRLLEAIGGPNLCLAWACYRQRRKYRVIFTDGEQVGIPLAGLLKFANLGRRPAHLMISHILSVGKKIRIFDWLGLTSHVDIFFVYSTWQKQFIENRWKVPSQRVVFTPFMVDSHFFSPENHRTGDPLGILQPGKPMICSVGLEFRDYPTLIEAVRGLDVQVVIAAASPWSKRADSTSGQQIPDHVLVRRFSQAELRDLYAGSRFMVMPLYDVNFQAGVTAILEAMAMGRAVICSQVPGQTDVVIDGKTGIYVSPGNPDLLRAAIQDLLAHPEKADQMGSEGRKLVEDNMSLDCYVQRLNVYVQAALSR